MILWGIRQLSWKSRCAIFLSSLMLGGVAVINAPRENVSSADAVILPRTRTPAALAGIKKQEFALFIHRSSGPYVFHNRHRIHVIWAVALLTSACFGDQAAAMSINSQFHHRAPPRPVAKAQPEKLSPFPNNCHLCCAVCCPC